MKNSKRLAIRRISNDRARKEIGNLFTRKLSKGITKLDVSNVSIDLKIPGTQVEKIFYEFIKEGSVKQL
jgi:hypothetical protein